MVDQDQFVAWDGEYEKQWYDVMLPSGEMVLACWPNAGKLVETKAPFRFWQVQDSVCVRPTPDQSVAGILKCLRQ